MVEEPLELLITVVVSAANEPRARAACDGLLRAVRGRIVDCRDCSDEEPGCWSVTISKPGSRPVDPNAAASLREAVRRLVHDIAPGLRGAAVACEPPAAWMVVDDPEVVDALVAGGERLLVEAWAGGSPYPAGDERSATETGTAEEIESSSFAMAAPGAGHTAGPPPAEATMVLPAVGVWSPPPEPAAQTTTRSLLRMRVDVATDRPAGAAWQARAIASRLSRAVSVVGTSPGNGLLVVHMDLGPNPEPPAEAVIAGATALGWPGWSPQTWSGSTAVIRWVANPPPPAGIVAVELTASPAPPPSAVWRPPPS